MNIQLSIRQLLIASVVAVSFTACGGSGETNSTDSTQVSSDSLNPAQSATDTSSTAMRPQAEAILSGTSGDTAVNGTARFTANDQTGKVSLVIDITVPTKAGQSVAVHLHEHGDCGDKGEMAHGHWNPTNTNHGKWGSGSFHAGDIGNVQLDGNGKGSLTVETDLWSIGGGANKNILGKAVIVHSGVDDYTTQPTGNAGSRIGCGVIK